MATNKQVKDRVRALKERYERLRVGKESLLHMIDEAEVPEAVYNSNAIENSTLTLKETERILLEMEVSRDVSVREVFEAKNLARVVSYIREKASGVDVSKDAMLLLHRMLIGGINDSIAGRFRSRGEYVRVGTYLAPAPEQAESMLEAALSDYGSDHESYFGDRVARFHLAFERIHPFNDGNGRIGRVLMNWQLQRLGFPGIIVRDKEKADYYAAFRAFNDSNNTKPMEKVVMLALLESLHKRIAYLEGNTIIRLSEYAQTHAKSGSALANAARRQTIAAFREKGVWKISKSASDTLS